MRQNIYLHKNKENGLSLIEVVIASAIISVSLIFVIQTAGQALVISNQSVNLYTASVYLEEGAEAVRTIRDNGWSNISGLATSSNYYLSFSTSTNLWSLSSTTSTLGSFTRIITFTPVYRDSNYDITTSTSGTLDSGTYKVDISVSWKDALGSEVKKLSFYLSNIFS